MSAARPAAAARPLGRRRTGRPGVQARSASTRPGTRSLPTAASAAVAVPPAGRPERHERTRQEPRVRLVPPPASSRRRLPFGVLCAVVVLASLLAVLALNISLTRGAYHLHAVQAEQQDAAERQQALAEQLERAASPEELGRRAADLGMVEAGAPAFVELSDGSVTGDPEPAPEPTPLPGAAEDAEPADAPSGAGTPAADTAEESAD